MFGISWWEILLVIVVIMLLFGATRLPAALGGLGKGLKEFKKAMRDDDKGEPPPPEPLPLPPMAGEVGRHIGKRVALLPDGTLEVGGDAGDVLVEVDAAWVHVRQGAATGKIPVDRVLKVMVKS